MLFSRNKNNSLTGYRIPHNIEEIRKRIKIVVVDDEESSFPTQLLSTNGYTIEWWDAIDDRRLQRLERNEFDIIILDINGIADSSISNDDGIGVLERIKHVNPAQIIVAFSGQEYDIEKSHFFQKADDRLRKPVDFIKAKNLIDRIIEQKITIGYFWESLNNYLQREGISDRKIKKLEKELANAIKNERKVDYHKIKSQILKGVEISTKVVLLIKNFLELVGY